MVTFQPHPSIRCSDGIGANATCASAESTESESKFELNVFLTVHCRQFHPKNDVECTDCRDILPCCFGNFFKLLYKLWILFEEITHIGPGSAEPDLPNAFSTTES